MLYFDWHTFLIGLVILSVLLLVLWRRKHDLSYLFCFSAFWVYLMLVLKETIFPIPLGCGGSSYIFRVSVNWIPFYFGDRAAAEAILRGVVLNTLLTLPFGFGISFVMRVRFWDMLWQPLSVGLGIEALQLVISAIVHCGYRVIDVNDVIFNASGVLIGYVLFLICAGLYYWAIRALDIQPRGLAAYFYKVAARAFLKNI